MTSTAVSHHSRQAALEDGLRALRGKLMENGHRGEGACRRTGGAPAGNMHRPAGSGRPATLKTARFSTRRGQRTSGWRPGRVSVDIWTRRSQTAFARPRAGAQGRGVHRGRQEMKEKAPACSAPDAHGYSHMGTHTHTTHTHLLTHPQAHSHTLMHMFIHTRSHADMHTL